MEVLVDVRTAIDGNDPGAVDHFRSDHHVAGALKDLKVLL